MGRKHLLAITVLALVTACGGATPDTTTATTVLVGPGTPTTVVATTQPPATTTPAPTTSAPVTTTPPETTTTTAAPTPPPAEVAVSVDHLFFMHDSGGNKVRQGPFLISVHRPLGKVSPKALVEALMDGPTSKEEAAGISSAVPDVTVRSVSISRGVATVDLDPAFEKGGGSLLMTSRLAQLTYTLTGVEGVDGVRLRLGGRDVSVFSGEGIIVRNPMTRTDFEMLLPGILVETPGWGADVSRSFRIKGTAAVFEATFLWSVSAAGSEVVPLTIGMTDNGVGWGKFDVRVDVPSSVSGPVELQVWEASAEDGSDQAVRTVRYVISG